jgi:Trk K+ transport system NAD-binding subunit
VPARKLADAVGFETGAYFTEVRVASGSKAVDKSLREVEQMLDEADAQIVGMVRNETRLTAPNPGRRLRVDDILVIEAEPEALATALSSLGLKLEEAIPAESDENEDRDKDEAGSARAASVADPDRNREPDEARTREGRDARKAAGGAKPREPAKNGDEDAKDRSDTREIAVQELVVMTGASAIGRSAFDLELRTRYGLNLLAVSRQGSRSIKRLRTTQIAAGDVLLMQGTPEALNGFAAEFGCVPLAARSIRIPDKRASIIATVVMLLAIAGAAFGLLPAAISFAAGVLVFMMLRIVPLRKVYEAIDWPVIVLLAALIPVAGAMADTGTADLLATALLRNVAREHPVVALALILVVTMTLSDFMNNAATAAVMCPISISIATQLAVNTDAFLMAVAVGASCAFLTPIGHQNNTLILGPGGFRFGDYWRLGLPLELLVVTVSIPMLLWAWPL